MAKAAEEKKEVPEDFMRADTGNTGEAIFPLWESQERPVSWIYSG